MSKAPIVLIHGLFGSLNAPEIMEAFGDCPVFAPDLIGYGVHRNKNTDDLSLEDQADHVAKYLRQEVGEKVSLVGHSVGGAVSALVAFRYPELVGSYVSVEGNFTLKDAFWSSQIAAKPLAEVEGIIKEYSDDPEAWMSGAGVQINKFTSKLARDWLANQPASTIKAQARAVVDATGRPDYLESLQNLMMSEISVYLIAGEHSAGGWDTSAWANEKCAMRINIPGVGHLMMAESPNKFAWSILNCLNYQ